MSTYNIKEATGASLRPEELMKQTFYPITDFGASENASPVRNTLAVNRAIQTAAAEGGTVLIPRGTYSVYTILLASNVNLCLEEGAVLTAAKTDIRHSYQKQEGEGGNYDEPEVNTYVGIQDHGHTYFANSLVYGADLENVMIYGKGLFTGGRFGEDGILEYVLQGGDPAEPTSREAKGHQGEWFGNKGIALVRCKNVVLTDFSVTIGGHFAIIAEGCENLYAEHLLVDTTRDAFDIDCCRNVTVRHTVCNSLTDDALCLKASFGAGIFKPLENVLIEDCTVSGYDAGSVYAGAYTRDKLIALDRCGPTGRVKFGTESTCGYHQVTIRRVNFDRSRGFCLEAVDCSSLTDVIFENCSFDNVSSSPIFIRAGDRGRFPVTGNCSSGEYPAAEGNVRLDNRNWILPDDKAYHCYPARRYAPHYNRTRTVTADGHSYFEIVDGEHPVECNPANYEERDGHFYLKTWRYNTCEAKEASCLGSGQKSGNVTENEFCPKTMPQDRTEMRAGFYRADLSHELAETDLPLYANAIGCENMAHVSDILIRDITVTNTDPRYPILLMGLTDSHIKNIILENISVEYRGGLSMEHAVEQRQLNTEWKYSQFHAKEHVQSLPWLVNAFFLKNEGLLPRADWDAGSSCWRDDPYNVPELPEVYPESSNWGILPAYGLFAKHVDGLTLKNVRFSCKVPDGRHVCVFDDVNGVSVNGLEAYCQKGLAPIAVVTHHYRRHTNAENVPEQPYFTTKVTGLSISNSFLSHTGSDNYVINQRSDSDVSHSTAASLSGNPMTEAVSSAREHCGDFRASDFIPTDANNCRLRSTTSERIGNPELKPVIKCVHKYNNDSENLAMEASAPEEVLQTAWIQEVEIHAPAPGTPPDSLYPYPTVPCTESGYRFQVDTDDYPLPLTVHRPFIHPIAPVQLSPGEAYSVVLAVRNPASDISEEADNGIIYNEQVSRLNYGVKGMDIPLTLSCENLPKGAVFDPASRRFSWTPADGQQGEYRIVFVVNDGVLPEKMTLKIKVSLRTL